MTEVRVRSKTNPGQSYRVIVQDPGEPPEEAICSCEGWKYRHKCSHQETAVRLLCRWSEITGPEQQSKQERRGMICPRCHGPTEWRVDFDD